MTPLPIYDLVVIGSGYTGLATAFYMARHGASVLVIDRSDLSEAASGRNAGFCTINPPIGLDALRSEGPEVVRSWYRWFEAAADHCEMLTERMPDPARAAIDFHRVGNLKLAQTRKQAASLRRQAAQLRDLGIERQFLEADALDMPSSQFTGGLYDARSARLNPGELHLALAEACAHEGVDIMFDTAATGIRTQNGSHVIVTPHAELRGRKIVVATNGFSATTVPPFRKALFSVGSFLIKTGPLPPGKTLGSMKTGRCHSTSFRFPHYFRLTPQNELLFGGRASLAIEADIPACANWLLAQARRLLPDADLPAVAACWGGRLGFAPDKRPLFGCMEPGLIYAMGCAGHGVPTSLAMGHELSRRLTGQEVANPAPFWRNTSRPPRPLPLLLRHMLPIAQTMLRALDETDRAREMLHARWHPN